MRTNVYSEQDLVKADWIDFVGMFYVKANPLHASNDGQVIIIRDSSFTEKIKEFEELKTKL